MAFRTRHGGKAASLIVMSLMAGGLLTGAARADEPAPATLTVTGTATIEVMPDVATVTAGSVTLGTTAADAVSANSAIMSKAFERLHALGIDDRDIQTSELSIQPQYVYPNRDGNRTEAPRIVGYQVTNQVSVRVRDLLAVGSVFDGLIEAGINQAGGISFGVLDAKPSRDAGLAAAVADARAQAEIIAQAAGVRLGRILAITPMNREMPVPYLRSAARMEMAADTPVAPGATQSFTSVSMVVELEP